MNRSDRTGHAVRRSHGLGRFAVAGGVVALAMIILAVTQGSGHTRIRATARSAAVSVCPTTAIARFGAQLTISPCSGLTDAQAVTISGTGFGADRAVQICLGKAQIQTFADCAQARTVTQTDAAGAFTATLQVAAQDPVTGACAPTNCSITAVSSPSIGSGTEFVASQPVAFGP